MVIHDPDIPRGFWKVARVTKLLTGRDGHARGAILKVSARGDQATTLQRPLQLLYSLEIQCSVSKDDEMPSKNTDLNLSVNGSSVLESHVDDGHRPCDNTVPPPASDQE